MENPYGLLSVVGEIKEIVMIGCQPFKWLVTFSIKEK